MGLERERERIFEWGGLKAKDLNFITVLILDAKWSVPVIRLRMLSSTLFPSASIRIEGTLWILKVCLVSTKANVFEPSTQRKKNKTMALENPIGITNNDNTSTLILNPIWWWKIYVRWQKFFEQFPRSANKKVDFARLNHHQSSKAVDVIIFLLPWKQHEH